jgi:hypothetical protein
MGVWGARLYSGDFAMDLRATIRAVARLPFDGDKLLDILSETEPAAALATTDSDHTTFWLVVADQFARRGIVCSRAHDNALAIIDTGADIAGLEALGMAPAGLATRRRVLADVRTRIMAPQSHGRPRVVLRKAQSLLLEIGDVFAYPTFRGHCINPYYTSKELDNKYAAPGGGAEAWTQNGWSACVIIDRGRAFGFLSWYRPLTLSMATPHKPVLEALRGEVLWKLRRTGTCSALHFRRLELEKLGAFEVDAEKLRRVFPEIKPGLLAAANDISICEGLSVAAAAPKTVMPTAAEPPKPARREPYPAILGIEQILAD